MSLLLFCKLYIFICCFPTCIFVRPNELHEYHGLNRRQLERQIFGAYDIEIEEAPYQTVFLRDGNIFCGGGILSERWVVSAAQCFYNKDNIFIFRIGSSVWHTGGFTHAPDVIIIHPNFGYPNNAVWNDFDIALIKSVRIMEMNVQAAPICLPYQEESGLHIGTMYFSTGWAKTGNTSTDNLRAVYMPQLSQERCKTIWSITISMFCCGSDEVEMDTCTGDIGSPLVHNRTLYGITSYGPECGIPNSAAVYTNVAEFRDWIDFHMKDEGHVKIKDVTAVYGGAAGHEGGTVASVGHEQVTHASVGTRVVEYGGSDYQAHDYDDVGAWWQRNWGK